MNNEEKYIELLDAYLEGTLTDAQAAEMKSLVSLEPRLAEETELLIGGIYYTVRQSQLAELKKIDEEMGAPVLKMNYWATTTYQFRWMAAALAILVLGVVVWLFLPNINRSEKLFQAYYQMYPNIAFIQERSSKIGEVSIAEKAMLNYQTAKFEEALALFYQLPKEDMTVTFKFYIGNLHLALQQSDSALWYYDQVIKANQEFALQSQWYAALTLVREGKYKEARTHLELIAREENSYRKKALRLLEATGAKTK